MSCEELAKAIDDRAALDERWTRGDGMQLADFIRCGTLAHGHPCPPLVLGVRAGVVAMSRECEACGESVLASYAREVDGRRICVACEQRRRASFG